MPSSENSRYSAYTAITAQIIQAIEAGARNAEMPWHQGRLLPPANACTCLRYRGVNVVALWAAAVSQGFTSHVWATYRQWRRIGGQVRAGERASLVVFYKKLEADCDDDETDKQASRSRLIARVSRVFNADQVDRYEHVTVPPVEPARVILEAEGFVEHTGATIRHGGGAAFYSPAADYIQLPERTAFVGTTTCSPTESYYGVLFHELVHWSGGSARLARDLTGRFGSGSYAMEELVAELGAAFLCAEFGVTSTPRPDHAAYIADWLAVLKADSKAIFTAASQAMQASEYLVGLNTRPDNEV